ncbi:hypothetical protein HY409_03545 [Candidatus Gottesmanbacteria bacterium]|nr:hypothetical protein [Candidatus Gottesmanbacteria bacterium]
MALTRLSRFEEKKQQKRLILSVLGSVGIMVFLLLFGLKLLVGFSLFIDKIRGNTPQKEQQSILLPPVLDALPEATNSASLKIIGKAQPDITLIIYLNESETKKLTVPKDGAFSVELSAKEGDNTISAKTLDQKGTLSDLSNVIKVIVKKSKPLLEIASPQEDANIISDDATFSVQGKTEEENTVTINDRFVLLLKDGSFSFKAQLSEGLNTLTIIATDPAGNQTILERHVTYSR